MTLCAVTDCTRETRSRTASLCNTHYFRVRRTGETGSAAIWDRKGKACKAPGCVESSYARGECLLHARRMEKGGSYDYIPGPRYESDNPAWTGDNATYQTVHERLYRKRGKAKDYVCECGRQAKHWSYDHSDPNEKSEQGKPYSLDLLRYTPKCVPCHKRDDLEFKRVLRAGSVTHLMEGG